MLEVLGLDIAYTDALSLNAKAFRQLRFQDISFIYCKRLAEISGGSGSNLAYSKTRPNELF